MHFHPEHHYPWQIATVNSLISVDVRLLIDLPNERMKKMMKMKMKMKKVENDVENVEKKEDDDENDGRFGCD